MNNNPRPQNTEETSFWASLKNLRKNSIEAANKPGTKSSHRLHVSLVIIAMILPLLGWAVGAMQNPNGWMSRDPFSTYLFFVALAVYYWPVSLIVVCITVFILAFSKANNAYAFKIISGVVFISSLVLSIVIMTFVEKAETSEFTG